MAYMGAMCIYIYIHIPNHVNMCIYIHMYIYIHIACDVSLHIPFISIAVGIKRNTTLCIEIRINQPTPDLFFPLNGLDDGNNLREHSIFSGKKNMVSCFFSP